jgi:probable rRNA maturation factor
MVLNRQRAVRVSIRDLNGFLLRAQRKLRIPSGAITVCLVNNSQIARWNRDFRGKKGPTDVLSFPIEGEKHKPRLKRRRNRPKKFLSRTFPVSYLGDIAIAPGVARKSALRSGGRVERELRVLILHGILHLVGYDHETDTGQMERREKRLQGELGLS